MKPLSEVSNDEIGRADWINAVNPDTGQWETLWGFEVGETPTRRKTFILDVLVEKRDRVSLLNLIDRIEAVRGRLPPRIQVARENLQVMAATRPRVFSDEDAVIADCFRG